MNHNIEIIKNLLCSGKRTDNETIVKGHYLKTPLTSENFEADSFSSGTIRHCIVDENGVVFEIDINTLQKIEKING
jgi:hypothetical protein